VNSIGFLCVLALTGCAAPPLLALDSSHPASPRAAEAPAPVALKALEPEPAEGAAGAERSGGAEASLPSVSEPHASDARPHEGYRHEP
jgi:hypothetical protein